MSSAHLRRDKTTTDQCFKVVGGNMNGDLVLVLVFDVFELQVDPFHLWRTESGRRTEEIELTDLERGLLVYLVQRRNRWVTYDMLRDDVWHESVRANAIQARMSELRTKVPELKQLIKARKPQQYRLNADVSRRSAKHESEVVTAGEESTPQERLETVIPS